MIRINRLFAANSSSRSLACTTNATPAVTTEAGEHPHESLRQERLLATWRRP